MIGRAKLGVVVDVDSKGVGPGVDQASGKLGKLGGIARKAGLAVAAGTAVAAAGAVKLGLDSIRSASDVQQAFGALESVYGKNAGQVKKWAAGAATSVGLAKSEYANLSALVGSQLQGMGVSQERSAKQSDKLIRLGADLAATYGGKVSDAVSAVSSVLKGETDPIERYGVSIKQADITARLAALGQDKLTGAAGKQARAQAVLGMLTEQTASAQGAFGRESNTLAGQQERLGAKFENLKASLGEKLLPTATKFVGFLSDKFLPTASRLGTQIGNRLGPVLGRYLPPIIKSARAGFRDLGAAIDRNRPQLDQLGRVVLKVAPYLGKILGSSIRLGTKALGGLIGTVGRIVDMFNHARQAVQDFIGWVGRIKIPKINLPDIPGLAGHYAYGRGPVAGIAPSYAGRGGLATAASMNAAALIWSARQPGAAATPGQVIDARTYVTVQGALDPIAVARQIKQLLGNYSRLVAAGS